VYFRIEAKHGMKDCERFASFHHILNRIPAVDVYEIHSGRNNCQVGRMEPIENSGCVNHSEADSIKTVCDVADTCAVAHDFGTRACSSVRFRLK